MTIVFVAIRPSLRKVGSVFHAGLVGAAFFYTRIIVLFLLSTTTYICIDYYEQLVESSGSLMLRADTFGRALTCT